MRFPDTDALVLAFLKARRGSVPVRVSVPSTRPDEFYVVRRTGGGALNRVLDFPTVTVDAWAKSSARAAELAEDAREDFLHHYTDMPLVRGVEELTGPYLVPDPGTELPVYRFSMRLSVRASRS